VRSILWNYELPWLLLSGGDDSTIAAWDIRSNKLIFDTLEPCISISSMATHPKNPFTVITSHLDNSVIFWDLLGLSDIFLNQLKFILDLGLLETICDPHDLMVPDVRGKLSGQLSKQLLTTLKKSKRHQKLIAVIKFFN
jgi:WD40 repeat protein